MGERRTFVLEKAAIARRRLWRLFGTRALRLGFRGTCCAYDENRAKKERKKKEDELWVARFAAREISPSEGQSVDGRRTRDAEDVVEVVGGEYLAYLPRTKVFLALSGG